MTTQEQIESIQLLVDEKISDEDLKNIEERYKSKKLIRNDDTPYTQEEFILFFQYALSLIQSKYTSDWPKGRQLMQDLYEKSSDAGEKRDYLFYCAIAELKMKNYSEATKFAKSILYIEPFNHQAKALVAYIEKKQDRDLLIGAGVLGGAALVGTVLLGVLGGELINDMLSSVLCLLCSEHRKSKAN